MSEAFEIVTVRTGARSMRSCSTGEVFHPGVGPMEEAEALYVRPQRLIERAKELKEPFIVWDVGLGAAANAIAVCEAFRTVSEGTVELHSFDRTRAPLAFARKHAKDLGYLEGYASCIDDLLVAGKASFGRVQWHFHEGDFCEFLQRNTLPAPAPHAILYDPYSPAASPMLWTETHFRQLHSRLDSARSCLLTNYTRSTAVRVTLLLAGFFVGRGSATGDKDETTEASNDRELLNAPLGADWLERVRRSRNAAPLRAEGTRGPIQEADWNALLAHPQFA